MPSAISMSRACWQKGIRRKDKHIGFIGVMKRPSEWCPALVGMRPWCVIGWGYFVFSGILALYLTIDSIVASVKFWNTPLDTLIESVVSVLMPLFLPGLLLSRSHLRQDWEAGDVVIHDLPSPADLRPGHSISDVKRRGLAFLVDIVERGITVLNDEVVVIDARDRLIVEGAPRRIGAEQPGEMGLNPLLALDPQRRGSGVEHGVLGVCRGPRVEVAL